MALKLKNKQVLNLLNEWATDFFNNIQVLYPCGCI